MRRDCESAISAVVVYARGAIVTRRVAVPPLDDGDVDLVIPGLTALAEPGSVRARVSGEGRSVLSVQSSPFVPGEVVKPAQSEEKIRELEQWIARNQAELAHLEERRAKLLGLTLDPGLAPRSHDPQIAARTHDALVAHAIAADALAALDERTAALEAQQHALQDELKAAQIAHAWTSAKDRAPAGLASRVVTVRVSGRGAIAALELDYVVRAARWWPLYTLEIGDRGGSSTLWLEAMVAQQSGEDWKDVALALSTSDLSTDARLPELRSIRYGKPQPPKRDGYRPPPGGLHRMFAGWDAVFANLRVTVKTTTEVELRQQVIVAKPSPVAPSVLRAQGHRLGEDEDDSGEGAPELDADDGAYGEEGGAGYALESAADMPEMPKSRGGGIGAMLGAFGGAPAPKRSAAPAAKAADMLSRSEPMPSLSAAPSMARMRNAGPLGGGGGSPGAPPQGAVAEAYEEEVMGLELGGASGPDDQWLDFDRLRIGPPEDGAHRGKLFASSSDDAAGARGQAAYAIDHLRAGADVFDVLETRGRYDHRWDAQGSGEVPSDGRGHRLRIASFAGKPRFRFWAVPLEIAEVFREVSLDNPTPGPLLRGPVDVYVEGSLLTTSALAQVDRGGVLRVGLGVEDRLRIARNMRVAEDTAGLLGGSTAVDHHLHIEVKSSLGSPATVEVYDRLPITDDKGLEVKVLSDSPLSKTYKQTERGVPIKGGLGWTLELPAGGKAEVKLHYRLTLSSKSEVVGGNRRD